MTLATEIIGDLRQRMEKTNKTIDDTIVELISTKAVVNAVACMAEEKQQTEVASALYGVTSMLDAIHEKLGKRYRKDCKYLASAGCEVGTNSPETSDTI